MHTAMDILIAEDSPTQAEQLKYLLEAHGYTVTVAGNGQEALAAVRRRKPALVISDIVMPKMDGYTLCQAIKADAQLKDIPVILLTTLSDPKDILQSLKCGADNFIRKPYNARYLLSRIAYLQLNRQLRPGERRQPGIEIYLQGERHLINVERHQILDLLLSTYEQAVELNDELKARQQELARSNQTLDALYRIAQGLNQAISARQVVDTALARVMELPDLRGGWILLRTGQSRFWVAATRGLPPALATPGAWPHDCPCRQGLLAGEFEHLVTSAECPCLQRAKDELGGRHHVRIPLRNEGRAIGVMNLIGTRPEAFGAGELKTLQTIGNQIGAALGRAWLYEHLEEKVADRTAALTEEIAERQRADHERERSQQFLQVVLDNIQDGIAACNAEGRLTLFNQAARELHGRPEVVIPPEQWAGHYDLYRPDGKTPLEKEAIPLYRALLGEEVCNVEMVIKPKSGQQCTLLANGQAMFDAQGVKLGAVVSLHNITERKAYEAQLAHQATHDALTQLPNRYLLQDRLKHALTHARRVGHRVAVLFIDLDRFKAVNDSLGHTAGDSVLQAVAARLRASVREEDTVARQGGDEFIVVLQEDLAQEDLVTGVARRIRETLEFPLAVEEQEFFLSASIGISLFPKDGEDAETLLKNADAALYRAKEQGGNGIRYYAAAMNARALERLMMEKHLHYALERQELVLHYQPQVDMEDGRVIGVEALLRWQRPGLGMVPPMEFIPLAEKTGLILPIGEWVLRTACTQAKSWQDQGLSALRMAVNLSPRQFMQVDLAEQVARILQETGLAASCLELEITESLLMQDVERGIATLHALKAMGVQLTIDDFGTGYSSLAYLKRFPIDRLKIDRSFVHDITTDPNDAAITQAVIALAHSMALKVIAEGVETEAQLAFLKSRSCNEMQGYYFSLPLPAEEIMRKGCTLAVQSILTTQYGAYIA